MEVQIDQLEALNSARPKAAELRNELMFKREDCYHELQDIDLALTTANNLLRNLTSQRDSCCRSAKSLSAAWLGLQMPDVIASQLSEKQRQIDALDKRIKAAQESQATLTERRGDKNTEYQLADRDFQKADEEVRVIDRRITELRGF